MKDLIFLVNVIPGSMIACGWLMFFFISPFLKIVNGRTNGYWDAVKENIYDDPFFLYFSIFIAAAIVTLNIYGA